MSARSSQKDCLAFKPFDNRLTDWVVTRFPCDGSFLEVYSVSSKLCMNYLTIVCSWNSLAIPTALGIDLATFLFSCSALKLFKKLVVGSWKDKVRNETKGNNRTCWELVKK